MKAINERFPSFFLDNDFIKQSSKTAQKKYKNADYFTFFTFRKLSIYVSHFLLRLGISAMQITILSMIIFALSIVSISILPKELVIFVFPLLWHLGYFFDVVDGEMARIKNKTSYVGAILDKYIFILCIVAFYAFILEITYGNYQLTIIIVALCASDIFFNVSSIKITKTVADISMSKALLSLLVKIPFIKPGSLLLIPIFFYMFDLLLLVMFVNLILLINLFWSFKKFYQLVRLEVDKDE